MTRDIWLISDTHFQHSNMVGWKDSGRNHFKSTEEMDELMIHNWNENVKPGDIVYHLGDVFFGDKQSFDTKWKKLHGRKRLIIGNHDDIKYLSSGSYFQKVQMWRKFPEFGILLSHVPLSKECLWNWHSNENLLNVHGHVHMRSLKDTKTYRNICVEVTDFKPLNIDEVRTK